MLSLGSLEYYNLLWFDKQGKYAFAVHSVLIDYTHFSNYSDLSLFMLSSQQDHLKIYNEMPERGLQSIMFSSLWLFWSNNERTASLKRLKNVKEDVTSSPAVPKTISSHLNFCLALPTEEVHDPWRRCVWGCLDNRTRTITTNVMFSSSVY